MIMICMITKKMYVLCKIIPNTSQTTKTDFENMKLSRFGRKSETDNFLLGLI